MSKIMNDEVNHLNLERLKLCEENQFQGMTDCIAIDCEMVRTGAKAIHSILAKVSLVNRYGNCIYDKYVKPKRKVTDYRTEVSGIRPEDLQNGEDFQTVRAEVAKIIRGKILVGHSIDHDLMVLSLQHPKRMIRDSAVYFRQFFDKKTPSLKTLAEKYLGVEIQQGEHDSIIDAQATMRLYVMAEQEWEAWKMVEPIKPNIFRDSNRRSGNYRPRKPSTQQNQAI